MVDFFGLGCIVLLSLLGWVYMVFFCFSANELAG